MIAPFKISLYIITIFFLFFSCSTPRKTESESTETKEIDAPKTIHSFIPEGFELLDSASGDLNKDTIKDYILIIKIAGEDSLNEGYDNPTARPLLILIGEENGGFALAARNDHTVLCKECGGVFGDPYEGITIKNGYFSVEHYGGSNWRWVRIITYKYDLESKNWYLHQDGRESFHTGDPENSLEKTTLRVEDFGKVLFENFDIYGEQ